MGSGCGPFAAWSASTSGVASSRRRPRPPLPRCASRWRRALEEGSGVSFRGLGANLGIPVVLANASLSGTGVRKTPESARRSYRAPARGSLRRRPSQKEEYARVLGLQGPAGRRRPAERSQGDADAAHPPLAWLDTAGRSEAASGSRLDPIPGDVAPRAAGSLSIASKMTSASLPRAAGATFSRRSTRVPAPPRRARAAASARSDAAGVVRESDATGVVRESDATGVVREVGRYRSRSASRTLP